MEEKNISEGKANCGFKKNMPEWIVFFALTASSLAAAIIFIVLKMDVFSIVFLFVVALLFLALALFFLFDVLNKPQFFKNLMDRFKAKKK